MKQSTKTLSLLLCLIMMLSAFAVITVGAESATAQSSSACEHSSATVAAPVYSQDGFVTYSKASCSACGAVYYTDCVAPDVLQDFDLTTKEGTDNFKAKAVSSIPSLTSSEFVEGTGLRLTSSDTTSATPLVEIKLPKNPFTAYKMSFTVVINKLPASGEPGFFSEKFRHHNHLLQIGRNADYDETKTDNTGYIKVPTNNTNTTTTHAIKEGTSYTFDLILRPDDQEFDLIINGQYIRSRALSTSKWTETDTPIYWLGRGYQMDMVLKAYSLSKLTYVPDYTVLKGSNTTTGINNYTNIFRYDDELGAILENKRTSGSISNSNVVINDKDFKLGSTPFTFSFDFMMTSNGEYNDSINTSAAPMTLISWLNSATSGSTKYGTLVSVGGIDSNGDNKFEKFFLVTPKNSGVTVSENNGNQSYTTAEGGEVAGYISDHNSVFTFEAGEWVTVSVAVNPITNSAYLYANGELVSVDAVNAIASLTAASVTSALRICDNFKKFHYDWAVKNIDLQLTPDTPGEVKDTGTIFNIDFGKPFIVGNSTNPTLGSGAYSYLKTPTIYRDTADADGYAHFNTILGRAVQGHTNLFNLSLTSQIDSGLYYNHLDGSKYAIETTFALCDRTPTDAEQKELTEFNQANNKNYTITQPFSTRVYYIIRMIKYNDNNTVRLIDHNGDGLVANTNSADALGLYVKNESGDFSRASAWYTEADLVNGRIPDSKFLKLQVVVDESNDTFSVYVNGSIAYYKDGDTYKRATQLKMKVETGANSLTTKYPDAPESAAWLANPNYSTLPRTVTADGAAQSYGTSGLAVCSYIRFFQAAFDFSVKNVSVTKIDSGLEFVGTQIRTESETPLAFDLRFVFATDDIYVDKIEYDVSVDVNSGGEGNTKKVVSNTVFRTLKSDAGEINAWKFDEGDYFSVFSVDGIELGTESTRYTFKITPKIKKYNPNTGNVETNVEASNTIHIVEVDGFGKLISYQTESSEWEDIKSVYTPITEIPYKSLGRTQIVGAALTADWSAAGFEFNATCVGNVSVNLTSANTSLFTVVVDGVEYKDVALTKGTNVIAANLPYGNHNFKIMNQSGYSKPVDIAGITLRGTFGEVPATSSLLIEYIGDSITHGCALGSPNYKAATNDGTLTYAFLSAKELGADYTIMANSGMGIKWAGSADNRAIVKYPYLNDIARGTTLYDGYTKAADLVVIGLSTNDNFQLKNQYVDEEKAFKADNPDATAIEVQTHMDEWKENMLAGLGTELELLIAEIEAKHGKTVPIILARGMMEQTLANDYPNADTPEEIAEAQAAMELYHSSVTYMTDLIKNEWQGKYGDHVIKVAHLTPDRTGYSNHPTREGAAIQGADLAEFIRTEFSDLVPAN